MSNIIKHQLVEIAIKAGETKTLFVFPELNNLRNVNLLKIQAYYVDIVSESPISGKPVINKNVFKKTFLTLQAYDGNNFDLQRPFATMQTIENGLSGYVDSSAADHAPSIQEKDFKSYLGQITNWPKSTVSVSSSVASEVTVDSVFLISVYYYDPTQKLKGIMTSFADKK